MRMTGLGLVIAGFVAIAAALAGPYARFLVGQLAIIVIAVTSLNLLSNVAGMLSLASAAFMGLGGYTVLIFLTVWNVPLALAIPLTLVVGWFVGWAMGLVAIRLSGISLAIVTFGFIQIFQVFAKQGGEYSGDGYGLVTPQIVVPGIGPLTPATMSVVCVFVATLVVFFAWTLTWSRIGRAWFALKENPVAAEMQGINLLFARAQAFATSGVIASLAGVLQALLLGITNPNLYTVDISISHLAMMVVGGSSGGVAGAVLGPAVLFFLPEYFDLGSYREVLYGAALLATLALAPRGLGGAWDYIVRRIGQPK